MLTYSFGICQTVKQVQQKIDSLNFLKMNLQSSISATDKEIQKQKNLLQTLRGLELEKSVTINANKPMNLLDDRSISDGKVISKIDGGSPIKLISFDGEYYYAEANNLKGYIYYPYLSDTRNLEEFKSYGKKKINDIRATNNAEQSDKNRTERRKFLTDKYGYEMANLIISKRLKIGMTESIVRESIGSPNSKNISHYASGTHEQWVYKDKYVYLENGLLTAWQENR